MQLMPKVARAYGLTDDNVTHNEANIEAAAKIIASHEKALSSRIPDREERKNL